LRKTDLGLNASDACWLTAEGGQISPPAARCGKKKASAFGLMAQIKLD